jgi:predicted nucleotidyltransferase
MRARAVWLAGSLGRGQADEWSDVDLIVVGGSPHLDGAPPDMAALDGLRAVFSSIKGHDQTRILVDRYLQVVEALTRH